MNYRDATYGRDLRLHQEEAERALQVYEKVIRQKRGRIIFLSGEPGIGRTDILQTIYRTFCNQSTRPRIMAGQFCNGQYVPWRIGESLDTLLSDFTSITGQALSVASKAFGPLLSPIADLIGQMMQISGSARNMMSSLARQGRLLDSPQTFKLLLRRVAAEPLICLIDDLDKSEGGWIPNLLCEVAPEIAAELPILLILTMKGPPQLQQYNNGEPILHTIARYLVDRDLAQWWSINPLSRDEVAAWIGPSTLGMVGHLHGVTAGLPRWVIEVWKEWQEQGRVRYSDKDDQWQWIAGREAPINLVNDLLNDRLQYLLDSQDFRKLEQTRQILACAALEGSTFTADAVAQVIGMDRDDLVDFLDEVLVQSEEQRVGILKEEHYIFIEKNGKIIRNLCRYSFTSDLYVMALTKYALTPQERRDMSEALAHILILLYSPQERLIARLLTQLFKTSGRNKETEHFQRMADYKAKAEEMRLHALYVLTVKKDDWDENVCWQICAFFLEAGWQMLGAYPHEETLSVFEEAYKLACRAKTQSQQVSALYSCGTVYLAQGDYDRAREVLQKALEIEQRNTDHRMEADIHYLLARVDYKTGNYKSASNNARKALEIGRKIDSPQQESAALHLLATIDIEFSDYKSALEKLEEVLSIKQEIADLEGEAATLNQLSLIDAETGHYESARGKQERALQIQQEIGDIVSESVSWHNLATMDQRLGLYEQAFEKFEKALKIKQAIGDKAGEAATLSQLCSLARDTGHLRKGIRLLVLSFLIYKSMGHSETERTYMILEVIAQELELSPDQLELLIIQVSNEYQLHGTSKMVRDTFIFIEDEKE